MRNSRLLPLAALLLVVACGETPTEMPLNEAALEAAADVNAASTRTYQVTIHNLTNGQPLTPPLVATHSSKVDLFKLGHPASFELKEIAENGNLGPMHTALLANPEVSDVVIAVGSPPPVLPGGSISFTIDASGGAHWISWFSMLICTNDGLTGLDDKRLPAQVGQTKNFHTRPYDAGTEINTEDFADMVPPCPPLTGVPSTDPGTGMSDPALAQNGVIRHHPGIHGDDDLSKAIHGFGAKIAEISITRIS